MVDMDPSGGLYSLGADQILEARVVNYKGEILDADDELLYGIRVLAAPLVSSWL